MSYFRDKPTHDRVAEDPAENPQSRYRTINWIGNLRAPQLPVPQWTNRRQILALVFIIVALYLIGYVSQSARQKFFAAETITAPAIVVGKELRGTPGPNQVGLLTIRVMPSGKPEFTAVTPCEMSLWRRLSKGDRVAAEYRIRSSGDAEVVTVSLASGNTADDGG